MTRNDYQPTPNREDRFPEEHGCSSTWTCDHPTHLHDTDRDGEPHDYCELPQDDGTMPSNVQALRDEVVGRKVISATQRELTAHEKVLVRESNSYGFYYPDDEYFILELDNGKQVIVANTRDCCASTYLHNFLLDPAGVGHMILGVGTEDGFSTWHIYADFGDVVRMNVEWSPGNAFYYGYGFDIAVIPIVIDGDMAKETEGRAAVTTADGQPALEAAPAVDPWL